MSVLTVTTGNFEELVKNSAVPVLIDFWAPWCSQCRMLAPTIEELAEKGEGYAVGKVNTDEEPQLAADYGVMSLPTLIVFKGGEVAGKAVGARPRGAILAMIDQAK